MNVEGFCRSCYESWDAHWLSFPAVLEGSMNPQCPYCKSEETTIVSDEHHEQYEVIDPDEEE